MEVLGEFREIERSLSVHHVDSAIIIDEESRVVEILREDGTLPGPRGFLSFADGEMSLLRSPSVGSTESHIEGVCP